MAVVGGVLVLAMAVACLRHYAQQVNNGKLGLGPEGGAETHFDYQVRLHKRSGQNYIQVSFSAIWCIFIIMYFPGVEVLQWMEKQKKADN